MEEINKNCGIYKVTSPTGRIYVGQSSNLKRRFRNYRSLIATLKDQVKLYRSFLKHGVENHQFDVIEYCSREQLNCSERFWQDEFDAISDQNLNCLLTKCGDKPKVVSEETRRKISASSKGKTVSEETRKKIGDAHRGEKSIMYGKNISQEHKDKISNSNKGRKHSEETRERMREASLGKIISQEQRDKLSEINMGSKHPKCKLVLDTQTGIFYDYCYDAAIALGMNPRTLNRMLNPNNNYKNKTSMMYV